MYSRSLELQTLTQIAEMKRIYSVICSSLPPSGPVCLVVASALPGEGKTVVAAGLASVAARHHDRRVLGIDLNWHKPALHKYFGLEPAFSLHGLKSDRALVDLSQPAGIEHLDILTAPKPDGTGDLPGARSPLSAAGIIKQAREVYDVVIIDTAAILPTNRSMVDPVVFSKDADGAILVVLNCVTPRQEVKRAHMILEASGAKILGVVVNQWKNPVL